MAKKSGSGDLSDDDRTVWAIVAETVDPLKPSKGRRRRTAAPAQRTGGGMALLPSDAALPATAPAGLDGNTGEKLRRGELAIDGRLDLHGLTQDAARVRLDRFIRQAYAGGARCVLIITGKGKLEDNEGPWFEPQPGILRKRVPQWLAQPPLRNLVVEMAPAQQRHGGAGAMYVYIRRDRTR